MKTFKNSFILVVLLTVSAITAVTAQVTIGGNNAPQSFSVLELISNNTRGMRLPQLTTQQRDTVQAHFGAEKTGKAMGLQIFNTKTKCVETWNGVEWIQQCPPSGPALPPTTVSCGITPTTGNNTTYTAKPDPNAEYYEFFVSGVSKGEQTSNVLTLGTATAAADITVAYLYPSAFLKPTMIAVTGSSSWKYGSGNTSTNVTIRDFSMSRTEITQAQYEYVMGQNPAYFKCGGGGASYVAARPTSALPVEYVNLYDAALFCNKLSVMEGKTPCYSIRGSYTVEQFTALPSNSSEIPTSSSLANNSNWNNNFTCDFSANGYRLPTESEWEYAARGGNQTHDYYFAGGGSSDSDVAAINTLGWYTGNNNIGGNPFGTKPVATKAPNELGLYDMTGNVLEWCWDWFDESTFPSATPNGAVTPLPPVELHRVVRGGCFLWSASNCTVYFMDRNQPYYRYFVYGFRVVLGQ